MTVKLPDGSRATVNGMDYTSGAAITLDPKKDFYRLTMAHPPDKKQESSNSVL